MPPASANAPVGPPTAMRALTFGTGATWWADGWRMFRSNVVAWIGVLIAYVVVSIALNAVPRIGAIASWLLTPVFVGGIMLGCAALERGEPLRIAHLFDGFKGAHFVPLLLIGLLNLGLGVLGIVAALIVLAVGIGTSGLLGLAHLPTDPWEMWRALGYTYLLLIVVVVVFLGVIAMANWFAPALVVLRDAKPLAAMSASVRGCLRNWRSFLIYGLIGIGIGIVTAVAFGVLLLLVGVQAVLAVFEGTGGWGMFTLATGSFAAAYAACVAVVAAVAFGSTYASYRDAFGGDETVSAAAA